MGTNLEKLKHIIGEIYDINTAMAVLDWDQQVNMPDGGSKGRAEQLSTLSSMAHKKFISEETGELISELKAFGEELDPEDNDSCLLKTLEREYDKKKKIPAYFVGEFSRVTAVAQRAWEKAREESNFSAFRPHLEQIFEMRREYADFFQPYEHIYDPLLDDFEPGLKTSEIMEIFKKLKPEQVELINAISEKEQPDDSFLHQSFDPQKQWDFGVSVISDFGYDWNCGRQDKSAHPFTTTFNLGDVRITTRVQPDFIASALFGTMHEAGHGMYEQGIDPMLERTPLATGASLAIHESQSRLWENIVGRSLPFWQKYYPQLQKCFPSQLGSVELEKFYKGINRVEPSLVRVEADEATYNLHIMLRLEIETAIMEGKMQVKNLPEIWNTKMKEYLGVSPDNDADGVLQDVHWSCGIIGYFPTYALGNLISAQIWELIKVDIPDIEEYIQNGQFALLLEWLREKIHRHGAKFKPAELVKKITGRDIDHRPYMRYLSSKYSDIYGI